MMRWAGPRVHVKNIEMQKMRSLLANRKLLKRKLVDVENHIRGRCERMACWSGRQPRRYEARVRELIEHTIRLFDDRGDVDVRRRSSRLRQCTVLLQSSSTMHLPALMTVPGVGPVAALRSKSASMILCALRDREQLVRILA